MPITFAHPAAVLPLARTGLPLTALAIGSMVPDLPMFVRLPWYEVTHGPWGVFGVDVALGAVGVALWVLLVRDAVVDVAPEVVRGRFARRFTYARRDWWLTPVAASVGALTHVVWDLFTHPDRWGSHHIPWLAERHAGLLGTAWLQHASSVLATAVLVAAFVSELRKRPYEDRGPRRLPSWTVVLAAVLVGIVGLATVGSLWGRSLEVVAFNAVITTIVAAVVAAVLVAVVWRVRGPLG